MKYNDFLFFVCFQNKWTYIISLNNYLSQQAEQKTIKRGSTRISFIFVNEDTSYPNLHSTCFRNKWLSYYLYKLSLVWVYALVYCDSNDYICLINEKWRVSSCLCFHVDSSSSWRSTILEVWSDSHSTSSSSFESSLGENLSWKNVIWTHDFTLLYYSFDTRKLRQGHQLEKTRRQKKTRTKIVCFSLVCQRGNQRR